MAHRSSLPTKTLVSFLAWGSRLELEEVHAAAVVDPRDSTSVAVRHDATVFRDQEIATILALNPPAQGGDRHLDLQMGEPNARVFAIDGTTHCALPQVFTTPPQADSAFLESGLASMNGT